jgi:Zn-dependent peptidase ImmA (M78 family)/transcriptional regulator with XRE-family HTH domain
MIYGTRIRMAREFLQVPQFQLAEQLEISASRLAQIERTDPVDVSEEKLHQLVLRLRQPPQFFATPPIEAMSEGSMRFRARATAPAKVRASARREAELELEVFTHLLDRVDFPVASLPSLPATTDIEEAAQQARAAMGIGPDVVVPRVIRAIESAGVVVLSITTHIDGTLDGFSTWWGPELQHPVLALSDHMPWDRYRLTALHEVGHLILHRGPGMAGLDGRQVEKDADRFASAFLLPRDQALEELPRPLTLGQLLPLKQRWGMSLQALLSRALEVGVIDQRQSTSLWKQLSARKWRKVEPLNDLPRERPRALRKMAEVAYDGPTDGVTALATSLGRYRADVQADLRRYAVAPAREPQRRAEQESSCDARVLDFRARRHAAKAAES